MERACVRGRGGLGKDRDAESAPGELGLATTVAPLTSTVLAAAESRHSGVASGINNAVARTAIAWFTIRNDVLQTPDDEPVSDAEPDGSGPTARTVEPTELRRYFCGVEAPDTGHCDPAPTT